VEAAKLTTRIVVASLAGIITFLGTMTAYCDDIGGVPTWDRCRTWIGTPAYIPVQSSLLDLLIPLSIGFVVAGLVWWLSGFTPLKASKSPAHNDT
jgi:hypothetical protein